MRPTRELGSRPIISLGLGGIIGSSGGSGPDPFTQYLMTTEGDQVRQYDLGSLGVTETVDPTNGNEQYGVLTDDTVITLDTAPVSRDSAPSGALLVLWLTQDGTGGWVPTFDASSGGSFSWEGGTTPDMPTDPDVTFRLVMQRVPGSTNDWLGAMVGTGGTALTVEDEGTPLTTAADTLDFVGGGVTATGSGSTKTITIPGGSSATDTNIWRPVMDGSGNVVVDGTGQAVMAYGPA